jgi:hypothetical protein
MSKLSRREFKNLLIEWKKNFINEKYYSQITKKAFQNIHSLNTKEEIFPELNIDVIEYDHKYLEIPEEIRNLLINRKENADNYGIGFKFSKKDDYLLIKKVLDIFWREGKIKDRSYESILKNNNGLIISPVGFDNDDGSKNKKGLASNYENSTWMLHDIFHSLLKNTGWNSSDGLVNEDTLTRYFNYNDEYNQYKTWISGNLITDYFNDHLTHHNINNKINRSVSIDDHMFDMPIFITYFGIHIKEGIIDKQKSKIKLKTKLLNDFENHHILKNNDKDIFDKYDGKLDNPEKRKAFFIKYFLELQDYIIEILNEYISNPIVYLKVDLY